MSSPSLEGLRRAALRHAPEGHETDPLWTGDDTAIRRPFAGTSMPAEIDPLFQIYRQREFQRVESERHPMGLDAQREALLDPSLPQHAPGGYEGLMEGLYMNQPSLGKNSRVIFPKR